MSAHTNLAWLWVLAALTSVAGCIEPSKIEDADQLIAAASLRDGGSVDLLPQGGGGGGAGAGGSAGRSGSGGAAAAGSGGRSGSGGAAAAGSGGRSGSGGGGGGAGGSGGAAASNCGDIVATFILPTCASEFCHGATGTSPLKLMTSDTAASLIGSDASMMCDGELYIDPDAPEQSLLYTKLGAKPPCGMRMPYGGMQATDAQRACVLSWIMDEVAAAR